uniref:DHC_N2 domain-containing protein n=1 Tax=Caenorhabditis japonica TaxID=281687 RepID=A0A8R1DS61_CAEJA
MYDLGFGNIYHPKIDALTCRDIPRDLEYNNQKWIHHQHQGRRIKKQKGRLLLFRGVEINGRRIKNPDECLEQRKTIPPSSLQVPDDTSIHEECLPQFPGWKGQLESLTDKLKSTEEAEKVEKALEEIEVLWKDWIRSSAKSYLQGKDYSITYNRPPSKHKVAQNIDKISDQLRLNTKIITTFFKNYRERCLIDCSFLLSENGRTVAELEKQLKDFVKHTKRILSFEWPMSVANLMLDEGASWIPLFVTSASQAVFNSVAATMSRLLYDVIVENITRVKTFFDVDDRARLIIQLREEDEEFDYWQKIKVLLELCKIPRVDHKIYPRVFTEAWIDVTNWFNSEKIAFKTLPNPFETTKSRIAKMQEMLITAKENPDDIKFWELLAQEILSLRDETLRQCTRTFEGFIIYDISEMKRNYLAKIAELEEKTKSVVLTHLSAINSEIRLSFSRCSSKLFRNDVLTQLRNIEEVQNEMPSIKEKIRLVGSAYKVYMEYFIMPDYDIRQFYEISRLGMKLEQLVNFVWDRINHERQWITKQVSEQTTKNYYECEMIEKEWLDCLKKYRSSQRINEVQKIQIKMSNLEEKSRILKEKDEKLIGQRSLLGLPASPIDCTRISKICEFFANLSLCHFQILLHHESCLRMRISEVDHNFLVAETERLQAEKDKLAEQAIAINEHVTTSKEALSKMQSVLAEFEKLLPVLGAISCQAMKDRHWQQILQGSESTVKVEGNPLVSELLEMNFIEQADKFEEVGAQAEKERILETSIEKMRNQWKSATFITHHGGELLTTELNVQMQAHLARSQTIITSPHALSILDHIRHWLDTLLSLNTFVQLYKQCDVRWRKIEGVFSTEDIAYQMPQEFRTFKKISLKWVNINNRISEERPILEQMELVEQLNMELSELEVLFGRMENGFHAYLRKKRAVFPRLFCLSDELVLSLICDSREPANCKSYLPLLFPALTSFEQNTKMEIVSVSTVSETIPLVKPVNVNSSKRHVEKWMHELDAQIKYTLKTKIRRLIEKMNYKLSPVESVLGEPVQVAVVYLKIAFAFQMENSMKQNSLTILASELKICLKECQSIIIHKRCQKEFLGPLFHVYKAASRLTNKFINEQVIFLDDPRWTSHLRYYWHMENVFIRVCTVSARYDYEIQSAEFVLDQESVDQVLKNFIFMNHFGFNIITPRVNAQLARQVAGALGKPFAICDSEMESDCKMLIEGSLLLGGIVYMLRKGSEDGNDDIGVFVERDVYSSRIISNLKYTFETEISISTSFMLLLKSAFRTAKVVTLDEESYKKTIDENFSMHSISHREKKIQKFQIFTEFENYLGARNLWKNYLQTTIANIIENEALEQEQSIENVLYHVFGAALARKNKKLMKKLLLIAPTKSKKTMTPSSKNLDPDYLTQKAEVLCNLLQKHKVVVVCGASQTGKSRMISMAARMKAAELQVEFGMWEEISNGGGETQKHKKHDKWIVIDGLMDPKTKQWINRLKSEFAIFSWRNLPIIAPGERVIVETDTIPQADEDLRQLPMVVLENQEDTARETNLDNNEQQRIDEIIDWSPELKSRKLEITRKIEELKKSLTFNSEKLTNYLTATSILSIAPLQKLRSIPNWKSESELTDFFQNIPFSNGWNKRKDTSDIPPAHFYIIHTISLILCSNYIPVLVCPPSKEFNEFLAVLQAELDKLDWHMITMSIDRNVTISEIKEFVDNCAIMFGGRHHISEEEEEESEGFNYFLIKGIEDAAPDVVDWLRHKFERKQIMIS